MADELVQICILSSLIATGGNSGSLFSIRIYQKINSNMVKVVHFKNNYDLHIVPLIGLIINTLCYPLVAVDLCIEFNLVYSIS